MKTSPQTVILSDTVFEWWDYPIFAALTCLTWVAIVHFIRYYMSSGWSDNPVSLMVFSFFLLVVLVNNQGKWFLLLFMKRPRHVPPWPEWKVGVATTFVPGAESVEMLEETVQALVAMDYPHETWVLDEGDSDEVKALCERLGAQHFSRKSSPHYQTQSGKFQSRSKHGNCNAWLDAVGFGSYNIVTMFDPDHVPQRHFLSCTLGYFNDPSIAYVQAAQAYYNQAASFISRGAAEETYAYYSSVQMASYHLGYPILVGCHNTHRVSALQGVGGLPAHDAEDLLLTMTYRTAGWRGIYLPEILARGLAPVGWSGYLIQQRRWARAVLNLKLGGYQTLSGKLPWKSSIISLLHGLNYLHWSFLAFIGTAGVGLKLGSSRVPNLLPSGIALYSALMAAVLLICELYRQRFYLDWRNQRGLHWRAGLLQIAKWPYFLLALGDVLLGRKIPYEMTKKIRGGPRNLKLFWPHMVVIGFIGGCWMIGQFSGVMLDPVAVTCGAAIGGSSLGVVLSGCMSFPDPFDITLRKKGFQQSKRCIVEPSSRACE